MQIAQRDAEMRDIDEIVALYGPARDEQVALREAWVLADGMPEPVSDALSAAITDPRSCLLVGTIDDVVVGFSLATVDELLPQAGGEQQGVIRLIYVTEPARAVGVGEAMLSGLMDWFAERGIKRFDAIVSPGHRLAKNFFESAGFKARRITMYRHDEH